MDWPEYFETNNWQRRSIPWERGVAVAPGLRGPLIRSLQRFQLGESGDGRWLRRHAAGEPRPYRMSLDFFIAEEQEHARLMARVLGSLDAPLLRGHWSDWCFTTLRRLLGLKQELLVLLVGEMIAKHYFRALHDGTDDPVLKAVCAQICHDEEGHLAFQVDHLRQAFAGWLFPLRVVVCALWRLLFRAGCSVVWLDHGALLRACGVRAEQFWWDCGLIFGEISAGIFGGAARPSLRALQMPEFNWPEAVFKDAGRPARPGA